MGRLSLLQGIFPTQVSNQDLLHCRRVLYQLNYQGSPIYLPLKDISHFLCRSKFPYEVTSSIWRIFLGVHIFSVVQSLSHVWLFTTPVDCSMPGFPVLHYLPAFAQTHVQWVGDSIQPSHPLSSPCPSAFNLSQSLGLISFRINWFDLLAVQGTLKESSPIPQFKSINSSLCT